MTVYRNYNQDELDAQYDQRTLVPDISSYLDRWRAATARARCDLPGTLGLAYGPSQRQRIDLFGAGTAEPLPILVYLHGGAWRQLSLDESGFMADAFVACGSMVAVVDFDLVPDVALGAQVEQALAAVRWLIAHAGEFGGDPDRIVLCGHSSGAHLSAMVVTAGVPVAGAVLVSGCYDLEPVRLSARNAYLKLSKRAARTNSPIHRLGAGLPPATIAYGDKELDEFQRQARAFATRWRDVEGNVEVIEREGLNHFDMNDEIARLPSSVHRAIRRLLEAR